MLPADFPEANKHLPRPNGWTSHEAVDLTVFRGAQIDTGRHVFVSYWKPSREDIDAINQGKGIYLKLISHVQVPVQLMVDSPFPPASGSKRNFWVLSLRQRQDDPTQYVIETISDDAEDNYFISDYYFDKTEINMLNHLFENTPKPDVGRVTPDNLMDKQRLVQEFRLQIIEQFFALEQTKR